MELTTTCACWCDDVFYPSRERASTSPEGTIIYTQHVNNIFHACISSQVGCVMSDWDEMQSLSIGPFGRARLSLQGSDNDV